MKKVKKAFEEDIIANMNPIYVALNNKREADIAYAAISHISEGSSIVKKIMCFFLKYWSRKWEKYIPDSWYDERHGLISRD